MRLFPLLLAGLVALAPAAPHAETSPAAPSTSPSAAQSGEARVTALADTMLLGQLFDVLGEEGRGHGKSLEEEMFPGAGGPGWASDVAAIYDVATLRRKFDAVLTAELAADPAAIDEMTGFFGSDLGQRILTLEIDARRALLEEGVEEAAQVAADRMRAERDPRVDLITRLAEANDLIEMNVAGALTGNLAFLQGMARENQDGAAVDADQMMSEVWSQEEQIRADTTTWLYSYLALAYQPLTDAELEAYIDFSATPAGKKLNAALFSAFDTVFKQVSHDLGRAAARAMQGSDI